MDKFKTIAKEGWHPERQKKDSYRSSTRPTSSSKPKQPASSSDSPSPPPGPFVVNTTGLDSQNLPPPPRRLTEQAPSLPSTVVTSAVQPPTQSHPAPAPQKAKPALPPRLPPREAQAGGGTRPGVTALLPTATHAGGTLEKDATRMNPGAVSRLAAAGVSVPGLGIGAGREKDSTQGKSAAGSTKYEEGTVGELQARFREMGTRAGDEVGVTSTGGSLTAAPVEDLKQAATKKAPPPAPPKKVNLMAKAEQGHERSVGGDAGGLNGTLEDRAPPPVPLGTKPK